MKTTHFYRFLLVFIILSTGISAQNQVNETILISGTKFTYPLIGKWIAEYAKVNLTATFQLAAKSETPGVSDLNIIAHEPEKEELKEDQDILYTGRYALLPVTNSHNPILSTPRKKVFNKKEIDKLFFEVVNYEDKSGTEKPKYRAAIYTRDNKACSSRALANYYGHVPTEIKGKKVLGDDIYLLSAIRKDTIGITFNNLGYLFDIKSRNLKEGIALLPLDLKKETKTITAGNLDDVLSVLEINKIETIPTEKIGFIYSRKNLRKEVSDFLKWVLNDGQKFNHSEGFLNLDKQVLTEQQNQLNDKLLTLK